MVGHDECTIPVALPKFFGDERRQELDAASEQGFEFAEFRFAHVVEIIREIGDVGVLPFVLFVAGEFQSSFSSRREICATRACRFASTL